MKKEWKIYIVGVPNRGDEVIETLKNLGGILKDNIRGDDPGSIYYIQHDGSICSCSDMDEIGQIILDTYKEIKLPENKNHKFKPKEGSTYYFISSNGDICITTWYDDNFDHSRLNFGNIFQSQEEAETMAEKFKKLLKDNL